MTDYWISGSKYWCEDCQKFISDNKSSRKHHENGATHLDNRRKRLHEMRKTDIERKKVDSEVDREYQRVKREGIRQHHQDLATLNKMPSSAAEYSTYQPFESAYGYGNTDTLAHYQPGAAHVEWNPVEVDWKYFDEEMIEAQRKRLFGDDYVPEQKPEEKKESTRLVYTRRRGPQRQEDDADDGGVEDGKENDENGEKDELYDPDVPCEDEEKVKPKKKEISYLETDTYEFVKNIDPSSFQYYTPYYRPVIEEEFPDTGVSDSSPSSLVAEQKRKRDRLSDEEDEKEFTASTDITKERAPAKSLSEALKEGEMPVVWKKPKLGSNKRGRRKR